MGLILKRKEGGTRYHPKQKKTIKPEPMSKNTHFWKGSHFETGTNYDYVYIGKIKDGKPNGIGALYKKRV
jgi:hypothetical protein